MLHQAKHTSIAVCALKTYEFGCKNIQLNPLSKINETTFRITQETRVVNLIVCMNHTKVWRYILKMIVQV